MNKNILTKDVATVYTFDGYGGISALELDWQQDCIFEKGDLNDAYGTIEDHFEYAEFAWYPTLYDCVNQINGYTEIEVME